MVLPPAACGKSSYCSTSGPAIQSNLLEVIVAFKDSQCKSTANVFCVHACDCCLQSIGNCTNGGGPGEADVDTCSAAVTSNTCAQVKYGPDQPRSCPFGGQDILYSLYGFNDNGGNGAAGGGRRR